MRAFLNINNCDLKGLVTFRFYYAQGPNPKGRPRLEHNKNHSFQQQDYDFYNQRPFLAIYL